MPHENFYDLVHHVDAVYLMGHLHQSMHISHDEMFQSCPEVADLVERKYQLILAYIFQEIGKNELEVAD